MSFYRKVPKFSYLVRWSLFMVPVLLMVGILGVGIGAQVPPFAPPLEKPLGVDMELELPEWNSSFWPPVVAHSHYERILAFANHFPVVCLPGREINDFQIQHCKPFREHFAFGAGLCVLPLILVLLGLLSAGGKIQGVYQRGGFLVSSGQPGAQGTVTSPARAAGDFFSWLYGFEPVSVQVANGEQKVVYLPPDMPIPLPGQKFRIYNMGRYFGSDRWTGTLHAPHLAIVSGSR